MTDSKPSVPDHGCAGCTIGSRREFLLDALRASAAALVAIGIALFIFYASRNLPGLIVPFKRPVYERVVAEFANFAGAT